MAWLALRVATSWAGATAAASAGCTAASAPALSSTATTWRSRNLPLTITASSHRPDNQHDGNDNGYDDDDIDQQPEGVGLAAQRVEHEPEALEHVHGRVHDDPHDVDEVPIDPRHLHAQVMLRRVMPAEGADRDDRQRAEADEHVRAVEPGQRVEDGSLGGILRGKADVDVLVDLD